MTPGLMRALSMYANPERSACVNSQQRKRDLMPCARKVGKHNLQNAYDGTLGIVKQLMIQTGD